MGKFHCCATCKHFSIKKTSNGVNYRCARLGYDTRPAYQFNCWDPKENVKMLMEKKKPDISL